MTPPDASSPPSFARKLYRALPQRVQDILTPLAYNSYELLNILRPKVWSVIGEMPGSQVPISVCLYSTNLQSKDYISKTIFGPAFRARYLGRTWLWNMQKVPKVTRDVSLVLSDLDARYLKWLGEECGVLIPSWIRGDAKLPRGPKERRGSGTRNALRKIRQHSLEFEISHDQVRFDDFYDICMCRT